MLDGLAAKAHFHRVSSRFFTPRLRSLRVSRDREHGFHRIVSNDFRGS
jgi:hypothetical protein